VPESARERVALRFLALSPHYFYDRDLAAEADDIPKQYLLTARR